MRSMAKFEVIFKSLDKSMWAQELDRLVPKGRYLSETHIDGTRHVVIVADMVEADLAQYSVEKFAQHVNQVCNTDVLVLQSSVWGHMYGKDHNIHDVTD